MGRVAAVLVLLLPLPAFALSSAVSDILTALAPSMVQLGALILAAHAAIYGMKLLREAVDNRSSNAENIDWHDASTHLDYYAEAPSGGDPLPDINPALLSDYDDIDFMVAEDMDCR